MKVKSESEVAQSCLTLHDPMDCSPPGSSVHGIFQARVLEWGAIAFSAVDGDVNCPATVEDGMEIPLKTRNITTICGEGNGTPLQYSCLENPMDAGAC